MAELTVALTTTTPTVGATVVSAASGVAKGTVSAVSPGGYYTVESNSPYLAPMMYSAGAAGTLHVFTGGVR